MNQKVKRILMSVGGVIICATSVAMSKIAALGVDPFQSMLAGADALIPISYGNLSLILNILLLSFSLIVDRTKIGIATFINLLFYGYIVEFVMWGLSFVIIDPNIFVRGFLLVAALIIMCFGSALYMTADLGVSTYDAVAIALAYKWKIAKFQYCRISTDLVCVILGTLFFLLAGGKLLDVPTIVGVGTIITAFFMGPLIEFFNVKVARPMLNKK